MTGIRGRFAPSPTGDLHAGSLLAALGSWLFARQAGGSWHVRIEDVDRRREVAGAAQRQLAALASCALIPDGPVVVQSQREALYQDALDTLLSRGAAFACWCSRSDLAGGVHRRCVRPASRGREPAYRLRVPDGTAITFEDGISGWMSERVDLRAGDFVLKRADGFWAYQLAVVVDDGQQGITQVVRGGDLLDSTPRQILLQRSLRLPTPRYTHLPVVKDAQGRKLSKSEGAMPVHAADPLPALGRAWRQLGQEPAAVAGAPGPAAWLAQALDAFDASRIPRHNGLQPTSA